MSRIVLLIFGLLDLFSFVRTYKIGISMLDSIEHFPIMSVLEILLIFSLIGSGVLSILRKKISLIIYYAQIPLRLAFMILTFGFLLKLFGLQYDSIGYKILVGLTFLLEIARLTFSIMIHKRKFRI
jgi:hypothetical protein